MDSLLKITNASFQYDRMEEKMNADEKSVLDEEALFLDTIEFDEKTSINRSVLSLYPLSNYSFGVKESQPEEDPNVTARLSRLYEEYQVHGTP